MADKKPVLKPQLTPTMRVVSISQDVELKPGQCLICKIDKDGLEVPDTEFTTSLRMWDKTYSKDKTFLLKKK